MNCVLPFPEQASGYGGTVSKAKASEKVEKMQAVRERELTIRFVYCVHACTHTHTQHEKEFSFSCCCMPLLARFAASTSAGMRWQFKPHQREIKVGTNDTLAFTPPPPPPPPAH